MCFYTQADTEHAVAQICATASGAVYTPKQYRIDPDARPRRATPTPGINYVLFCILCEYNLINPYLYRYTPKQYRIDSDARPRRATPTPGINYVLFVYYVNIIDPRLYYRYTSKQYLIDPDARPRLLKTCSSTIGAGLQDWRLQPPARTLSELVHAAASRLPRRAASRSCGRSRMLRSRHLSNNRFGRQSPYPGGSPRKRESSLHAAASVSAAA